jgi:uncharacterized protein YceK
MKSIVLTLALALAGCATCREHPTACAVTAVAIVAAGVIVAREHGEHAALAPKRQCFNLPPSACR